MSETEDTLRRLLSDLDPMPARVPVEAVTSPQARQRLEQIMQTTDPSSTSNSSNVVVPFARRRKPRLILAVAASVAVLGIGTTVAVNLDNGGTDEAEMTTMALTAPGGDAAMMMCMRLDAEALRPVPVALAGTVTTLTDETVTLDVTHWYKGGTAERVTIARPPGDISPALIPGVEFEQGKAFLITATEGTVNGCGFSGPESPELKKVYDEAFPG